MATIGDGSGFPVAPPEQNVIDQRDNVVNHGRRIETPNATIVATEDGRIEIQRKARPVEEAEPPVERPLSTKTLAEQAAGRAALDRHHGRVVAQAPVVPGAPVNKLNKLPEAKPPEEKLPEEKPPEEKPPEEKPMERVHRPADYIPDPRKPAPKPPVTLRG